MPRSLPGPLTCWSFTRTSPESARSRPAINRNRVDLPQPDGPSRTRNSPISRPAGEYASSISKLMFSSALTHCPSAAGNVRLTFRTVILDFLCSMFCRLQVRSCTWNGCSRTRQSCARPAPREQLALEKRQQESEQECGDADCDDAGVDSVEIQNFASGLDHIADALTRIQHPRENHVCPADIIEDSE